MQCCSVRGHYQPNRAPNTESAVGLTGPPYAVLFSTVCCTDPTVLVCGNGHWFSCPTRSTITRLPSGSSISHSALFRDPALSVGVGTAHGCTRRVGGTLSHPRSARAVSFGVSLCIHPHLCGLWFRVEYHPSPYPRTSAASAQPRLAQRLRPHG